MNVESFAVSVSRKRIRLTSERWTHIETRHPNLQGWRARVLETIESPEFVVPGRHGELLSVKQYSHLGKTRFLVVVYREMGEDGFIITAVLTSDVRNLRKRGAVWPKR
jgi:hypothetical protein